MRTFLFMALLALAAGSLAGCNRGPRGNWLIETGRARIVTDAGVKQTRLEAVAMAQNDARMKLLRSVETMAAEGDALIGDHMARDPIVAARVQSMILSAPRFQTRFPGDLVEVDMGVNVDQVRQVVANPEPEEK